MRLTKQRPVLCLFGGQDVVAGDCFLLRHDEEGESISVTIEDINKFVGHGRVLSL